MMRTVLGTVIVVAGVLPAAACARSEARQHAPDAPPVPVTVAPVSYADASPAILAVGTLGAKEEVPLSFKIGGVVARVSVEAGEVVPAGALLAELAPTEIAAEVEKAHQARAKAERDMARARSLYKDSVATLEQLQDATTAFDVAESNVKIAEFNRQYAVVRAPDAGVVLKRTVEPGQLVSSGAQAFVFRTDRRGVVLRAGLSDRDVVRLHTGDPAVVRFDAFPGEKFHGRVTQIAAAASSATGTYEVEVAIEARGRSLASGLVGHVELSPRGRARVPAVPVQAILEANGDSATLFTLSQDGATAVRRRVRVGALEGAQVTVLDGLDGVRQVVTAGSEWLADGAKVKLRAGAPEVPAGRKLP